jgi:hypothetical protein
MFFKFNIQFKFLPILRAYAIITSYYQSPLTGVNMFDINAWSDEFFKQPTEPMNPQMTGIFFNMSMMEDQQQKLNIPEIQNQFLYQVIDKRTQHIGLNVSDQAKVFLMFQTKSPGTAVMYLYALRSKFTSVNMGTLAQMFPMGFLKEEGLEKMWDKQKGHPYGMKVDNCLDHYQFVDTTKKNKP